MPSARRWINHWSLWSMASATPDLRLHSQPQSITAPWPVPNYTAWWQRHVCVNNLPKVVIETRNGRDSNRNLLSRKSNALTITPPGHTCCYWPLINQFYTTKATVHLTTVSGSLLRLKNKQQTVLHIVSSRHAQTRLECSLQYLHLADDVAVCDS